MLDLNRALPGSFWGALIQQDVLYWTFLEMALERTGVRGLVDPEYHQPHCYAV